MTETDPYIDRRMAPAGPGPKHTDVSVRALLLVMDLASVGILVWLTSHEVSMAYGAVIAVLQPFVFREKSLYWRHSEVYRTIGRQVGALLTAYLTIFVIFCVVTFVAQGFGSRPHPDKLLMLFGGIVALNVCIRLAFALLLRISGGGPAPGYIVLGTSPRAQMIAEAIANEPRMKFVGYVRDPNEPPPQTISREQIIGSVDALGDSVLMSDASHVVVVLDSRPVGELLSILDHVAAMSVIGFIYNDNFNIIRQRYKSRSIGGFTVVALDDRRRQPLDAALKRVMDIVVSLSVITLFAPFFPFLALAIKLDSPGPIFYVSDRVRNPRGETFKFYKFRSMRTQRGDEGQERKKSFERFSTGAGLDKEFSKVIPTGAVTLVGRLLRKSSLDELPQIVSVLRGDMSIVGPRPCTTDEFPHYKPWQKKRFGAKPGLTGLWQVVARSKTSLDEQAILDIYYARHRTVWFDLEIIIKTVPVVLYGKGAA